jgi:23S rRNA (adenine2030-N6)-methyltransferase
MNYRHAYHAGNFADVLKHIVFIRCLAHLRLKDAPFRVIDTHAGTGLTRLDQKEAAATAEWRGGIDRLLGPDAAPLPSAAAAILAPYLEAVRAENPSGALTSYPGSPLLARSMLRAGDKLIVNELHAEDGAALRRLLSHDKACKVLAEDGYQLLKSALPPPERRGLILIDPPFEEPGELVRMTNALAEGLARFATGMYVLWYPIKDEKHVARFHRGVSEVAATARIPPPLKIELLLRPPRNPLLLNGCGLVVVNPPFTLRDEMACALPELAQRMGDTGKGTHLLGPLSNQT